MALQVSRSSLSVIYLSHCGLMANMHFGWCWLSEHIESSTGLEHVALYHLLRIVCVCIPRAVAEVSSYDRIYGI